MTSTTLRIAGAALTAGALWGCSSSSGGSTSCSQVSPCGGSIVGTWKIANACVTGGATPPSTCPGESSSIGAVSISGTATFNADGTFTVSENTSVPLTVDIPTSCLTQNGTTLSCSDIQMTYSNLLQADAGPTSESSTASCTSTSSSCNCQITTTDVISNETGTYTVSGSTFTSTSSSASGAMPSSASYCVQGSTLYLISESDAGPSQETIATRQ